MVNGARDTASWVVRLRPQVPGASRSVAAADVLTQARRRLGAEVTEWAAEAACDLFGKLDESGAGVSAGVGGPSGIETELLSVLMQLEERTPIDEFEVSLRMLQDARSLARAGFPAVVLNEAVWRLHVRLQDAMQAVAAPGAAIPGSPVASAGWDDLLRLTRYSELAARRLLEAHADEERSWNDSWVAHRREVIGRLLAGEHLTAQDEHSLGIRLSGTHLLAVVAGTHGSAVPEEDGRIAQFSAEVSATMERGTHLAVGLASETLLWWSRAEPIGAGELERVGRVAVPLGLSVSFGDPHSGAEGAARSYNEAQRASKVARVAEQQQPWLHADVLLASALLADPAATTDLVQRELSGVLGRDSRTVELRRTVLHFLRSGGSRVAAASELDVAPTTVAYRVESFERLRGRRLSEARLETWVALEVAEVVPSTLGC